jgi:ATP-dependent exoDNAse (exonuclease V) beta subunit
LYSYKEGDFSEKVSREVEFLSRLPEKQINYPAARISPSLMKETSDCEERSWKIAHSFGSRIKINGKPEMDKLGNAVHAYLDVEHKAKAEEERLMLAKRIMKNWDMEEFIDYSEVADAGNRLNGFLDANYMGCKIFREWPMFMRNDEGQVIQGWIDMLIETREGYVIVDHKDYPGADVIERAEKYKTQLIAYEEAVEKSTGRPVVDILLHFPISGLILKLK